MITLKKLEKLNKEEFKGIRVAKDIFENEDIIKYNWKLTKIIDGKVKPYGEYDIITRNKQSNELTAWEVKRLGLEKTDLYNPKEYVDNLFKLIKAHKRIRTRARDQVKQYQKINKKHNIKTHNIMVIYQIGDTYFVEVYKKDDMVSKLKAMAFTLDGEIKTFFNRSATKNTFRNGILTARDIMADKVLKNKKGFFARKLKDRAEELKTDSLFIENTDIQNKIYTLLDKVLYNSIDEVNILNLGYRLLLTKEDKRKIKEVYESKQWDIKIDRRLWNNL